MKRLRAPLSVSGLSDRALAIEAYARAPDKYRHRFDRIVEHMDNLVLFALRPAGDGGLAAPTYGGHGPEAACHASPRKRIPQRLARRSVAASFLNGGVA